MNKYSNMSSYWVSKWFCGKNTKQVHKERKQVDLQWFMVLQDLCVKKVARSQGAGQQWSTESWSPGAATEKQWDDELKLLRGRRNFSQNRISQGRRRFSKMVKL